MDILPKKCILLQQYRLSIYSTHNIAVTYYRLCMSPPCILKILKMTFNLTAICFYLQS